MKYVFLTFAMNGLSGGPSYVNYKVKNLNEIGIETIVIDHYASLNMKGEIVLENLLPYKNNRLLELFFPPSYFSQRQRMKILDRLINIVGNAEDYVVESNSIRLALWGEMLAEKLHAKHLIFCIGEHPIIRSKKECDYLKYKFNRNELFTIKPQVIQNMFKGYMEISDLEAQKHFFSASMGVTLEDVPMSELEGLPEAKYKILSFGRYKPYFDNMINGIVAFAHNHPKEHINFLIMGDVALSANMINHLNSVSNIFYKFIPAKRPVPQVVFDYVDVVIATAGCANLSYEAGYKTISMDVQTNQPLGVMGYTTIDSVFSSNQEQCSTTVCELLENVLIKKLYEGEPFLKRTPSKKGFQYQMSLINNDRQYWGKVDSVRMDKLPLAIIESIVLRMNCIKFLIVKKNRL